MQDVKDGGDEGDAFCCVNTEKCGLGLFASRLIPQGTVWWKATHNNILRVSRPQYRTLLNSELENSVQSTNLYEGISTYSFYDAATDNLMVILDNGRFVNHSDTPNSRSMHNENGDIQSVAMRDIQPGEEILESYYGYDSYPWPERWSSDPIEINQRAIQEYREKFLKEFVEEDLMAKYKMVVKDTEDRGLGLFIGVDAKKGERIFKATAENCLSITENQFTTLSRSKLKESPLSQSLYDAILYFGYWEENCKAMVVALDGARFMNHQEDGVTTSYDINGDLTVGNTYVRNDVRRGTELVDDYREYTPCPFARFSYEIFVYKEPRQIREPELL